MAFSERLSGKMKVTQHLHSLTIALAFVGERGLPLSSDVTLNISIVFNLDIFH